MPVLSVAEGLPIRGVGARSAQNSREMGGGP
jgi:hypothetical protein